MAGNLCKPHYSIGVCFTLKGSLHVLLRGSWVAPEQSVHGHDKARSAESTLRPVSSGYALLKT